MKYVPKYPKEKLEELRKYVENFKSSFEKKYEKAASTITESFSTKITKKPSDGDARYKFFNNLLFDGELPKKVKVYFLNSEENKSRSTGFSSAKRRKNYVNILKGSENTYGAWYPSSNSIYIFLDRLEDNDFVIDSVLVHEMCHVWQDRVYKGDKNTTAHSYPFQYAKRRTQKRSNNVYNIGGRSKIPSGYKNERINKYGKRPSSAGGKSKNNYGNNNNENNKNINNSIITKNGRKNLGNGINRRLASPQIHSNSNNMGFNNNMKSRYNPAKNRIPSPMIKSHNYKRPPLPNSGPRIRTNKIEKIN